MSTAPNVTLSGAPATRGGEPAFSEKLPLVKPHIPGSERLVGRLQKVLASGTLTNGPYVRELEIKAAEYLGVEHVVAVASCTAGLILTLRALEVTGEVIVPSFTFSATVHSVAWNGLRPVFADIDRESLTLSAAEVEKLIGPETSAIMAVHTYGTPCDVDGLQSLAKEHGLRLIFDAAHAFGSQHGSHAVGGFGDAEVFSLSPTKVLVAGEGGLIATNDGELAQTLRIGRDYGNPGNYDCLFVGLNARMSEVHAATALASLEEIEQQVEHRNKLAAAYREGLEPLPGISFPRLAAGDRSTYKDFTIIVDRDEFGIGADELAGALAAEGIDTRRYYTPLVHKMQAYSSFDGHISLPKSEAAAASVLTLPMWSSLPEVHTRRIGAAVARIWKALGTGSRG